MPELNPDIFQEVVKNIVEKRSLENLTKLMIAGRETLHGVLAHFLKAKCVHVTSSSIEVYWTNSISYLGGYQIALDFAFLKSVVKAMAENVIKVKIDYCRDNPIFDFVVSHLITKKLKSVDLSDTLSEDHLNSLFKGNCFFEELSLPYRSLIVKKNLPETCKILNVSYIDFVDIFKYKFFRRITFQFVESLTISEGEFKVRKLNKKSINKLLKIITKSFPSLKELNATFEDEKRTYDVDGMVKKVQNLQSNCVCKLKGLSHIQGRIIFHKYLEFSDRWEEEFEEIKDKDMVIDEYPSEGELCIEKHVQICENFLIQFKLTMDKEPYYWY